MYMKWFLNKSWLRLCLILALVTTINCITSTSDNFQNNINYNISKSQFRSVISHSEQNEKLGENQWHKLNRRAVIQAPLRLIEEKQCPEIRNLCTNLRDGADDLPVLECIQTFLSNQIESLSDECQHAIWSHTGYLLKYN